MCHMRNSKMLNLFKSESQDSKEEILNNGYRMALEFGKNWLQPVNERLRKKYPKLSAEEIQEFSDTCHNIRKEGNQFIYNRLRQLTELQQKITEHELNIELTDWMGEHYPWVNNANIKRTISQGIYYAAKDGWAEYLN